MRSDRLISQPVDDIFHWLSERTGLVRAADFIGQARVVDGKIVAAFGYDRHWDVSCHMHFAFEKNGLNRTLLHYAFKVPFDQWGYRCILGTAREGDAGGKFATHLGFTDFAILPDAQPNGGLRFMVMRRETCRWLKPMGSY